MIRAIVVDDELLARKRLLKLLDERDDIKVIRTCKNGEEAVTAINEKEPDLVFLDIQMPDLDGFQVLEKIDSQINPYIIFATAYDQYAIRAFEVHALDYLLKPFDEDRLNEAILQAMTYLQLKSNQKFKERLVQLVSEYHADPGGFKNRFTIKERGKVIQLNTDDLYYLEANGNYVTIHSESGNHLYRTTMNALEKDLDPDQFLRIHRSYIINKKFISNYRYLGNNEYSFRLKNKQEIQSSRTYKEQVQEYISRL